MSGTPTAPTPSPEGHGPAPDPAPPLVQPGPRARLLATALLAALIGALVGGAAAWGIYQHYGPVQRIVNEQSNGSSSSQGQTVGELARAAAGSVVTIAIQPITPAGLADGTASLVDGVVVGTGGLILTSAHAVAGASQLRVGLPDGRGLDAEIAGVDAAHGLAVLRIPGATGLTPIALASAAPAVGDQAIALSRPASGGLSVGVGTVSAVGLTVTTDSATGATVQDAVSIDAIPEPSADGAPVLDNVGDVIGIVVTITRASAPPGLIALSLSAAVALVATASGATTAPQGTFGVEATYLDPTIAAASDLTPGALIESVAAGGPAAAAGLQVGDIVTSVNGIAIDATQPLDPHSLGLSPGDTAEVTVVRGTATQTVAVMVGSTT